MLFLTTSLHFCLRADKKSLLSEQVDGKVLMVDTLANCYD